MDSDPHPVLPSITLHYLQSMYASTAMLHIVQFILSLLLATAFYLFMLRPFLQETGSEQRRIAELLAQLPQEVRVCDAYDTRFTREWLLPPSYSPQQPQSTPEKVPWKRMRSLYFRCQGHVDTLAGGTCTIREQVPPANRRKETLCSW
jgi:hypothetical protein